MTELRFEDIVAPISPRCFLSEIYGIRSAHLKLRQYPTLDVDDFEQLLWRHEMLLSEHLTIHHASGDIPLPRRRADKDVFRWAVEQGRRGAALKFARLESLLPWAARLAGDSAHHLIASVEIDALLIPGGHLASACGLLHPVADLMIVQTMGRSRWRVKSEAIGVDRSNDPDHVELDPGDMFYLPGASVKGVDTDDAFAVCAVVRILPMTRADLLRALIEAVTESDAAFRRTVPQESDRMIGSYASAIQGLERCAMSSQTMRSAWDKLRVGLADKYRPIPGGYFAAQRAASNFSIDDKVRLKSGAMLAVTETRSGVCVYVAGLGGVCVQESEPGGLLFPSGTSRLVSAIAESNDAFGIEDLPTEYSERARLATVRRLILEGALEVIAAQGRINHASGIFP